MSFGRRNNFMDPDFDGRRGRQPPGEYEAIGGGAGARAGGIIGARAGSDVSGPRNDNVPNGLLKSARQSGVINLANKDLTHVPDKVWEVSKAPESAPGDVSLDRGDAGPRWWEVEEIRKLLLSANRLEELSDGIGQLIHLQVVDLRDNRLTHLPAALCELHHLRNLNASKNRLAELPTGLAGCSELTQLGLSGNCLTELPPDLGRLDCLAELDISDNQLTSLPDSLAMLSSLRTLEAGRNRLECLPSGLTELPALCRLGLSGNQLSELPTGPYPALEVLDAADNRLTGPPALVAGGGLALKELRLSNNKIRQLTAQSLAPLSGLRHLELRRNNLATLPAELPVLLPLLERLDLTDNDLGGLPYELGLMDNLKSLLLEGNPMRALRREVLARGTEAVKKHLASRIAGGPAVAEAAVEAAAAAATAAAATPGAAPAVTPAAAAAAATAAGSDQRQDAPKSFQSLQQQFDLDLAEVRATHCLKFSDRRISALPDGLLDTVADLQLTRFDLSGNDLDNLPDGLAQPPFTDSMMDLSLRQNRIASLDAGIGQLASLSVLDLSVNQLTSLPQELAQLRCLRQLVLSANRFEEVPEPVYALSKLENLLLSHNKIVRLDTTRLRAMESLGTLDLTNNSLQHVPPELGLCQRLRNLHLEGNAFRVPRPAQLAKGTAFVLEYLRNRIEK